MKTSTTQPTKKTSLTAKGLPLKARTLLIATVVGPQPLRQFMHLPIEKLGPEKLAANRKSAEALVTKAKAKAAIRRSPKTAARIKEMIKKRRAVQANLKAVLATRAKRSPDQVIASFVAQLAVKGRERGVVVPAGLLVRSELKSIEAFEAAFAQVLGKVSAVDLKKLGVSVRQFPLSGVTTSYSVRFPVRHRIVRTELRNLAWAIRKQGSFQSVTLNGLSAMLYAPTPTAATHAERDFAWHLNLTRTRFAHALEPGGPNGKSLGEGIVIAHPDTGWAEHPEYNSRQIDVARSRNVVAGRTGGSSAKHSIRNEDAGGAIAHGTATGSVILGGPEDDDEELSSTRSERALAFDTMLDGKRDHIGGRHVTDPRGHLTGVAPLATVLPIKFISDGALQEIPERGLPGIGPFRLFDGDLVDAIRYAIDEGAHVMSLSVGGLLHDEVRRVLDEAILDSNSNMIVVAAAGQTYMANALSVAAQAAAATGLAADDSVILPAAYTNVIAVAGCAPNGAPWSESHRGPNVDITAPADAVWVAEFAPKDDARPHSDRGPMLECASGTSFAASFMAGVAALWLAHWGRDDLLERYRSAGVPLAWVFRHQLQRTADAAHAGEWDDVNYGPGVVNVEALLSEPLPAPDDVEPPPAMVQGLISLVGDPAGVGFVAAEDAFLDFMDFFGGLAEGAGKVAAAGLVAAQRGYEDGMKALAEGWAIAESAANELGGQARESADRARQGLEQLIDETAEAGEGFLEETAGEAEEAWDALEEGAEEFIDSVGEAGEDVVGWLTGWG